MLAIIAVVAGVLIARQGGDVAMSLQLSAEPPAGEKFVTGVFSPAGSDLLVVTEEADSRTTGLAVRTLAPDRAQLRTIPGSEGATRPFWSPDGETIGFFAQGRLKRVGVNGGALQTVASIVGPQASGGSWGANS